MAFLNINILVQALMNPCDKVLCRAACPFRFHVSLSPDRFKVYICTVVFQGKCKIYFCRQSRITLIDTGTDS